MALPSQLGHSLLSSDLSLLQELTHSLDQVLFLQQDLGFMAVRQGVSPAMDECRESLEEVQKVVEDAINMVFGIKEEQINQVNIWYNTEKVNNWCNQIMDNAIRNLSKLNKPFKYCLNTIIQQINDAGLTIAEGAHYDVNTDGVVSVQKEINDIGIIVTVFAVMI